jgi:hypothetical protein
MLPHTESWFVADRETEDWKKVQTECFEEEGCLSAPAQRFDLKRN